MGTIVLKRINMTLDPKSVENALLQVELFEEHFYEAVRDLCEYLLNTGVEIAKFNLAAYGSDRSGALRDSIHRGAFDMSSGRGVIMAGEGIPYALYVEFGTGLMGSSNPPPDAVKAGWEYDVNDHGTEGWVYYDDYFGRFVWTTGQMGKPFMYDTINELASVAEREGGSIIAAYIDSKG